MNFQWITASAAVVIVLLAASPYINGDDAALDGTVQSGATDAAQTKSTPVAGQPGAVAERTQWEKAKDESAEALHAVTAATRRTASDAWTAAVQAWLATRASVGEAARATSAGSTRAWEATKSGASTAASATTETASSAWEATQATTQGWWRSLKTATLGPAEAAASTVSDHDR